MGQTSLALVLLIGSGLLVRSFWELRNVDPGYDTDDIFSFQIAPEGDHLPDAPAYARFHTDFMERVAATPTQKQESYSPHTSETGSRPNTFYPIPYIIYVGFGHHCL